MKSKLIIVGGFLGAGKTSLLWSAAKILKETGEAVGLITNDQAAGLVDTAFLGSDGELVREVSGSCFCCNFNGFADAVSHISAKNGGGIIIAEPVGSCTDLSATIMQPLKDKYAESLDLKPLTVLADPYRLEAVLLDASSAPSYIIYKQFEEADIILINKTDLITGERLEEIINAAGKAWPGTKIMTASVKTGAGVKEWLETVMRMESPGAKIAEVDYDIYADGEAAFGWLNATYKLRAACRLNSHGDFEALSSAFLSALSRRFDKCAANVGHVKFLFQGETILVIGNLTGSGETASVRSYENKGDGVSLTVNARVEMAPDALTEIVTEEVERIFGTLGIEKTAFKCLIPGRPNPTYRYSKVI